MDVVFGGEESYSDSEEETSEGLPSKSNKNGNGARESADHVDVNSKPKNKLLPSPDTLFQTTRQSTITSSQFTQHWQDLPRSRAAMKRTADEAAAIEKAAVAALYKAVATVAPPQVQAEPAEKPRPTKAVETFQQKEKRKRDIGQASRDKNYVEEEKRVLREAGGAGYGFD